MSIASLAQRTTNFTQTQASWELRSAGVRPRVIEVHVVQATGTAQSLGLGRPAARGTTPVNVLFQRDDPAEPACTMNASLSWNTSPTVPAIFHRRWNSAATVGVGMVWTFPRGLFLPINDSLVIWNVSTAVAMDVNCILDE